MSSKDVTTALSLQLITRVLYTLQRKGTKDPALAETSKSATSNKDFVRPGKLLSRLAILLSRGDWVKAFVKAHGENDDYKEFEEEGNSIISIFALSKKNGTVAFLARKSVYHEVIDWVQYAHLSTPVLAHRDHRISRPLNQTLQPTAGKKYRWGMWLACHSFDAQL